MDIENILADFPELAQSELGLSLSPVQLEQFAEYARFLLEYNSHTNLTRVPASDVPLLHFYDSLTVLRYLEIGQGASLIDVGSGAGFPGLALKIARPDLRVTLLDSTLKKVNFLGQTIERLALQDCRAIHERIEAHAKVARGKYDFVTARAVSETGNLVRMLGPLIRPGGRVVLYKGPGLKPELEKAAPEITKGGLVPEALHDLELPHKKGKRSLLVLARRAQ